MELVRAALVRTDVDQRKYCGHSLRIGAVTPAAVRGIEDSVIKTLGRWESTAFCRLPLPLGQCWEEGVAHSSAPPPQKTQPGRVGGVGQGLPLTFAKYTPGLTAGGQSL